MILRKSNMGQFPRFDPWRMSQVDSFQKLRSVIEEFKSQSSKIIVDEETETLTQEELAESSLLILKVLAITIASDSTRMLSFYQYGWQARYIFPEFVEFFNSNPDEYYYLDSVVDLAIHSMNNILDTDWLRSIYQSFSCI